MYCSWLRRFLRTSIMTLVACSLSVAMTDSILGQQSKAAVIVEGNQQDDDAQIRDLLKQQAECWNNADIDGFMETYWKSPKLTFSSGGATTHGWDATLKRYKERYSTPALMGTLKFEIDELHLLGKDAAFLLGKFHLTRENDEPHGNFTLILRKINGTWKIVHDLSSGVTE